jgi:hypothetical protein
MTLPDSVNKEGFQMEAQIPDKILATDSRTRCAGHPGQQPQRARFEASRHARRLKTDTHIKAVTKPENKNQNHYRPISGQASAREASLTEDAVSTSNSPCVSKHCFATFRKLGSSSTCKIFMLFFTIKLEGIVAEDSETDSVI